MKNLASAFRALGIILVAASCNVSNAGIYTFTSGPQASGHYNKWSPYYTLEAKAPPGERIVSATFNLRGHRRCGSWAVCNLLISSDTVRKFEFSLQGEEGLLFNPDYGSRESEGVLVIETAPSSKP